MDYKFQFLLFIWKFSLRVLKNDLILYQIDLQLITSNVAVPNWP